MSTSPPPPLTADPNPSAEGEEAIMAEAEPEGPVPDPLLKKLYQSDRPAVELLPSVPLSPIVNACWVTTDTKALLAASWIAAPAEEQTEEGAPAQPAFDASAPEYNELQRRLARSAPLIEYNKITIQIKEMEVTLTTAAGEAREALTREIEATKMKLAEVELQLTELKNSFQEDPLALVPWMQVLFELADAGLTTFDVSGSSFPYTSLRGLFGSDNTTSPYDGTEKLLGLFKKRYEREKGPNRVQILTKVLPNIYQDGFNPASVEAVVEVVRRNVYGPEATEPLDLVQIHWWDLKERDVLPSLKVLQQLSEDRLEEDPDTGEWGVAEPKKIRGVGLVDFPDRAILAAIQAGVPITSVQVAFNIADRSAGKALALCKQYGIKVLARDGTMGGLISEKFVGAPPPDTMAGDPDLDSVAHCLDLANNYGGWERTQRLLAEVKAIADKHGVKMETVALRWQIDQGTFPVVTTRWERQQWRQFGYAAWDSSRRRAPGVDAALFQVASFLDEGDMTRLNNLQFAS